MGLRVRFQQRALPDIHIPTVVPEIPPPVFEERFRRLEAARETAGFDCIAIYADREHCANMAWLTGFDPRFEEALWIQGVWRQPTLLVGNENLAFAPSRLKIPADVRLYQPFSLPNQDRSRSADLLALLRAAGVNRGMRCGLIGWKPMAESEVPHWIVRAFGQLCGMEPANAGGLLMDPDTGLRVRLEPEMIQFCEYASSLTSEAIRLWAFALEEGMTERHAAAAFNPLGLELSCHLMVNFGRPIPSGLKSPRNARARRGEYAQAAFGVIGALTCRAARLSGSRGSPKDPLGHEDQDRYLALVENYLQVVRAWYRQVAVGARAGDVVAAAETAKSEDWDFAVNPGHLLHLEEWICSPFSAGSAVTLKSGTAVQQDIIPVPRDSPAAINMEDGFVLADEDLRKQLERMDRQMMARIRTRRNFMEELGYEISADVLPLSNIAGAFFPFLFDPSYVAVFD